MAALPAPPTINNLDPTERSHLVRSHRKLEALLGTMPYVLDPVEQEASLSLESITSSSQSAFDHGINDDTALSRAHDGSAKPRDGKPKLAAHATHGHSSSISSITSTSSSSSSGSVSQSSSCSSADDDEGDEDMHTTYIVVKRYLSSSVSLTPVPETLEHAAPLTVPRETSASVVAKHANRSTFEVLPDATIVKRQQSFRPSPAAVAGLARPLLLRVRTQQGSTSSSSQPSNSASNQRSHTLPNAPPPPLPTEPAQALSSASVMHLKTPPITPLTASFDTPSPIRSQFHQEVHEAHLRRKKLAKLTRTLGENVPPELVFPKGESAKSKGKAGAPDAPLPDQSPQDGDASMISYKGRTIRKKRPYELQGPRSTAYTPTPSSAPASSSQVPMSTPTYIPTPPLSSSSLFKQILIPPAPTVPAPLPPPRRSEPATSSPLKRVEEEEPILAEKSSEAQPSSSSPTVLPPTTSFAPRRKHRPKSLSLDGSGGMTVKLSTLLAMQGEQGRDVAEEKREEEDDPKTARPIDVSTLEMQSRDGERKRQNQGRDGEQPADHRHRQREHERAHGETHEHHHRHHRHHHDRRHKDALELDPNDALMSWKGVQPSKHRSDERKESKHKEPTSPRRHRQTHSSPSCLELDFPPQSLVAPSSHDEHEARASPLLKKSSSLRRKLSLGSYGAPRASSRASGSGGSKESKASSKPRRKMLDHKGLDWGRRKEREWSGEWNVRDMREVVKSLRELKADV